ncbi:MAG: diguanylate cyclase [Candidatus Sulfotelmatobacter sp.]
MKQQILVVDADRGYGEAIASMLASGNYRCEQAQSGAEALLLLNAQEFDLVLTELLMPGLDVISLLQQIKGKYPNKPVAIVTGVHDVSVALACIRGGAFDYLPKPFEREQLLAIVRRGLSALEDPVQRANQNWQSQGSGEQVADAQRRIFAMLCSIAAGGPSSNTDSLTGLKTVAFLHAILPYEWKRAVDFGRAFSIVIIDLDNFKRVNDSAGHTEGDLLLQSLGPKLEHAFPSPNMVVRYGGSRFTVVMPEIGAEQARETAEKCRVSFLGDGTISKYQVTASFGIASFLQDGSPLSDIVDSAVEAMYAVKKAGGNCIAHAKRSKV